MALCQNEIRLSCDMGNDLDPSTEFERFSAVRMSLFVLGGGILASTLWLTPLFYHFVTFGKNP
jgi:hypothetical protein